MKHFFRFFGLLIFIFLLSSCTTDGNTTNVSSLTVNLSALPKKVNVENFDLELIKLTIVYQDGQTKEDVLKESMIDKESLDKLQHPGEHTINFTYENYKSSFNIKLLPITYNVVFYDIDGNVISEQVVSKGENANVPTYPNIEGFEYIGLSSNDYLNVSKDVNIYPIYNILNPSAALEEVGQYLYNKYILRIFL